MAGPVPRIEAGEHRPANPIDDTERRRREDPKDAQLERIADALERIARAIENTP